MCDHCNNSCGTCGDSSTHYNEEPCKDCSHLGKGKVCYWRGKVDKGYKGYITKGTFRSKLASLTFDGGNKHFIAAFPVAWFNKRENFKVDVRKTRDGRIVIEERP